MHSRLDQMLVERGLVATRSRARDLILRGKVTVGGQVATKPAQSVGAADRLALVDDHVAYVSRGAEKLIAALDAFAFDPAGRTVLDVGASTGGFTDVVLRRGAERVYAVDVGHGQLHASLRADSRVTSLEGCDARRLDATLVPIPVGAIVADVSFISLTKAMPAALALADRGCWLAALVKPQFEAGRGAIGKGGIVSNPLVHARVIADIEAWLEGQPGWHVVGRIDSPIEGGDGNREFLIGASKS